MIVSKAKLDGVLLIEPNIHRDNRGYFFESYNHRRYAEHGIDDNFVQDNRSYSSYGTIRGMHYQLKPGQSKLIQVLRGKILDVVVDIRENSPSFKQWESFTLDAETKNQVYIPVGFAHGFCVLSDFAEIQYKVNDYYNPSIERGLRYDDPEIGIEWPEFDEAILSERDLQLPLFADCERDF